MSGGDNCGRPRDSPPSAALGATPLMEPFAVPDASLRMPRETPSELPVSALSANSGPDVAPKLRYQLDKNHSDTTHALINPATLSQLESTPGDAFAAPSGSANFAACVERREDAHPRVVPLRSEATHSTAATPLSEL